MKIPQLMKEMKIPLRLISLSIILFYVFGVYVMIYVVLSFLLSPSVIIIMLLGFKYSSQKTAILNPVY